MTDFLKTGKTAKNRRMDNVIEFQKCEKPEPESESGYELRRRILNEFKIRGRKRPGRKPSGRVTFYMVERLLREGRNAEADALFPYITTEKKKPYPKTEYASESRLEQRYKARKEREREARAILKNHAESAKCQRNETVRFQISGEILDRVTEVAKESGLSVGEMCRIILASIAKANLPERLDGTQKTYPWWNLNGKI